MSDPGGHVCPVQLAGSLDNRLRRWLQNPRKILGPYVKPGMTVLDIGCGPGFFSIGMAELVGATGHVIAADLQQDMLQILEHKVAGTTLADRITLHKCEETEIGVTVDIDFALAFYMVHEVREQESLFREIATILKPSGRMLVVEPPLHVSKRSFQDCTDKAAAAGLELVEKPKLFLNKTALLRKR